MNEPPPIPGKRCTAEWIGSLLFRDYRGLEPFCGSRPCEKPAVVGPIGAGRGTYLCGPCAEVFATQLKARIEDKKDMIRLAERDLEAIERTLHKK